MPKYLIEIPHSPQKIECLRSVQILLSTGSHFLTNADWGCLDGEHKAWFIIDVDSREEALQVVPPFYRKDTRVTRLTRFILKDIEETLKSHEE